MDELPELGETIVKAFLMRRMLLLGAGFEGVNIIGSRFSPEAHRLRDFATRNGVPFRWIDLESDEQADALLRQFGVPARQTPIVIGRDGAVVKQPVARRVRPLRGLSRRWSRTTSTTSWSSAPVRPGWPPRSMPPRKASTSSPLDALAAGGQAGTSSRIENYLGFPTGISGAELTRNALVQAQTFGAQITVPCAVRSLGLDGGDRIVTLDDGTRLRTRCVLVASGVEYRKLDVPGFEEFEGAGIYYAATEMEARLCRGEEVVVVGGGNSAGQAVVFSSRARPPGALLVRGERPGREHVALPGRPDPGDGERHHPPRHRRSPALEGDGHLSAVRGATGRASEKTIDDQLALPLHRRRRRTPSGSEAASSWTARASCSPGTALPPTTRDAERWRAAGREPFLLETSLPGRVRGGRRAERLGQAGGVGGRRGVRWR